MPSNSLPTGTVNESSADRTRPVGGAVQRDRRPPTGNDGRSGEERPATEEVAALRATVAALERELDRREAEKQELVDRYERLLATQRSGERSAARTEPTSGTEPGVVGRVVGRVKRAFGR